MNRGDRKLVRFLFLANRHLEKEMKDSRSLTPSGESCVRESIKQRHGVSEEPKSEVITSQDYIPEMSAKRTVPVENRPREWSVSEVQMLLYMHLS